MHGAYFLYETQVCTCIGLMRSCTVAEPVGRRPSQRCRAGWIGRREHIGSTPEYFLDDQIHRCRGQVSLRVACDAHDCSGPFVP